MKKVFKIMALAFSVFLATAMLIGCASFDIDKSIAIVAREDGSGTKSAFMEIIGLKDKADPSGVIIQTGTAAVLAEVKNNPQSIAYESLGYVTNDVKKLTIDGVECSVANIKADTYKIARPLNIIFQESVLDSELNQKFYEFLQSSDTQSIIADEGYVALNDDATSFNSSGNFAGQEIKISGSTSLEPLMGVLANKFMQLYSGVIVTVSGGGSGTGYKNAAQGVSAFGMISEAFNPAKAVDTNNNPVECEFYTVAKDGIAVIVHKSNTFDNLTLAQVKNIYNAEAVSPYSSWADIN